MIRQIRALLFALAIGLSLWNSDYLVKGDASTTEGSCSADSPETCEVGAGNIETDANVNDSEDSDCQDEHPKCQDWANIGECDENPNYMLHSCRRSCLQCPDQAAELAKLLEEKKKKIRVYTSDELYVAADMGTEQRLENEVFGVSVEQASARIIAAREHIQNEGLDEGIKEICKNQHEDCTTW